MISGDVSLSMTSVVRHDPTFAEHRSSSCFSVGPLSPPQPRPPSLVKHVSQVAPHRQLC